MSERGEESARNHRVHLGSSSWGGEEDGKKTGGVKRATRPTAAAASSDSSGRRQQKRGPRAHVLRADIRASVAARAGRVARAGSRLTLLTMMLWVDLDSDLGTTARRGRLPEGAVRCWSGLEATLGIREALGLHHL